jgi:hypothetical protein
VNDAHFCGLLDGCVTNWRLALQASLAWLALPATDKITGTAMMAETDGQTGPHASAWHKNLNFGAATTHNGATLNFNVQQAVAGRSLYLAYRVFDPGVKTGGTAVVSVDGVFVTALSATVNTGHVISTQNNTTDTIFLASVPLGSAGAHAITITTTSPDGSFFSVMWAGASSANYATTAGAPMVVVGTITLTGDATLNQNVAAYNAQLPAIVAGFVAEGMHIMIAPTGSALAPGDLVDLLHPANAGHAKLAAAFQSVLQN